MRIHINLATQPYEDVRAFYARWLGILGIAAIITIALVTLAAMRWSQTRDIERQISEVRRQIAELDKQRAEAQAVLDRTENRDTRDRSRFINDLIARKAFSWTQIMTDLEAMMPPRAQVVSIRPNFTPERELELRLIVGANSRDPVLELVRRMEKSERFRSPEVTSEVNAQTEETTVQFEIAAIYVPPVVRTQPATTAQAQPAPAGVR